MADRGKGVSRFFSNSGKMVKPIQRVNVDFTAAMLEELENAAKELNISRQAVIKTLIRQALDQRHLARAPASSGPTLVFAAGGRRHLTRCRIPTRYPLLTTLRPTSNPRIVRGGLVF
jgi:hypothetical protein